MCSTRQGGWERGRGSPRHLAVPSAPQRAAESPERASGHRGVVVPTLRRLPRAILGTSTGLLEAGLPRLGLGSRLVVALAAAGGVKGVERPAALRGEDTTPLTPPAAQQLDPVPCEAPASQGIAQRRVVFPRQLTTRRRSGRLKPSRTALGSAARRVGAGGGSSGLGMPVPRASKRPRTASRAFAVSWSSLHGQKCLCEPPHGRTAQAVVHPLAQGLASPVGSPLRRRAPSRCWAERRSYGTSLAGRPCWRDL